MNFSDIKALVEPDLIASKKIIAASCYSNVPLIIDISSHLLNSNSKQIRPLITILCSYLCDYRGEQHINIAAALELIHTATLLHDDVIDNSKLRRGQTTANYRWGNDTAVLIGDFFLAKSSQIITALNNIEILKTVNATICDIVEGELLQLANKNNLAITQKTYLQIISAKTAKLFELAAALPATLADCSQDVKKNIAAYGMHLGIAFQLTDDLLDPQDLTEGNLTLPIIYLLTHGSKQEKNFIKEVIHTQAKEVMPELQTIIASSGAIAYTIKHAKQEATLAKEALSTFANSIYKDAAYCLIDFIISRDY